MITIGKHRLLRQTQEPLGGHFGPDSERSLVVELAKGDLLVLRPKGTRQVVSVPVKSVYRWCLENRAMHRLLEKARERKAQLAARRDRRRRNAAEVRFKKSLKD